MPKTKYFSANGMLIGEQTNGVSTDYVPDALGSIVAAVDQNLNTTYTAAYAPYGTVIASTGTAPNCTWVGALNYSSAAGVRYAEYAAGARIVSKMLGRWTSIDSLWPEQPAYGYASASPVFRIDPSGCQPPGLTAQAFPTQVSAGYQYNTWGVCVKTYSAIVWVNIPHQAGWIIQEVTWYQANDFTCGSGSYSWVSFGSYFEAWKVDNSGTLYNCQGLSLPQLGPHDRWHIGVPAGQVFSYSSSSQASFVPRSALPSLDPNVWSCGGTNSLWVSETWKPVTAWSPVSTAAQSIEVNAACCGGKNCSQSQPARTPSMVWTQVQKNQICS